MAQKTIDWSSGGGSITAEAPDFSESQALSIRSTANNNPDARSKDIVLRSNFDPTKSVKIRVNQQAGVLVYSDPVFVDFHYDTRSAAGGTLTPYLSVKQSYNWNGIAGTGETLEYTSQSPIDGPVFSYQIITAADGLSIDAATGIVTWAANTGAARSGVIRCTVTWNGMTVTRDATVRQNADEISSYSDITINSFTVADIPASGGNISQGTYTAQQTVNYVSGRTTQITSGFHASYSAQVFAASKGTTASGRTNAGTLTLTLELNGKTASKAATVYQAANTATYGNVSISGGAAADIPASGGTRKGSEVTGLSYSQTVSYTSGSTRAGSCSVAWSANVTAASLGTTGKSRTQVGTLTATVTGEGGKSNTRGVAVYQAANTYSDSGGVVTYGNITAGAITNKTIPASGGEATATAVNGSIPWSKTAVIRTWTSGSTQTVSAATSGSEAVSPSVASAYGYAASKGTTQSGVTTIKTQAVTWSAHGKSASGTMYVYQAANAPTNTYGNWGVSTDLNNLNYSAEAYNNAYSIRWTRPKTVTWTSGSVQNLTETDVAASASSNQSWVSVSVDSNKRVAISASANTGAERSATITVTSTLGLTHSTTVTQAADRVIITIACTSQLQFGQAGDYNVYIYNENDSSKDRVSKIPISHTSNITLHAGDYIDYLDTEVRVPFPYTYTFYLELDGVKVDSQVSTNGASVTLSTSVGVYASDGSKKIVLQISELQGNH